MNLADLNKIAVKMVAPGRGILAADQQSHRAAQLSQLFSAA
jgi:fructose-bisphosphate aldolase class 1